MAVHCARAHPTYSGLRENLRPLADKHKARGEVPFATFEGSEQDKYPQHFSLRRKGADGADKVCARTLAL